MESIVQPFAAGFKFTDGNIGVALTGLTEEQALWRLRDGQGGSIAWNIGHIMDYRCMALESLGIEKARPYKELFSDQGANDGSDYPSLSQLKEEWDKLAEELHKALEQTSHEQFTTPLPSPENAPHSERRVLDNFTFFTWHEAYHLGSIGMIRKELNLPSISEIVVQRMREQREAQESS